MANTIRAIATTVMTKVLLLEAALTGCIWNVNVLLSSNCVFTKTVRKSKKKQCVSLK